MELFKVLLQNQKIKRLLIFAGAVVVFSIVAAIIIPIVNKPKEEPLKNNKNQFIGEPVSGIRETELQDGMYYIKHNGLYYPVANTFNENFDKFSDDGTDCTKIASMDKTAYKNIPTLYIGNKDKFVFHSTKYMNSYVDFERYTDAGYSIGIYGLQQDKYNKTFYIPIDKDKKMNNYIDPSSDAFQLNKDFKADKDNNFTLLTVGYINSKPVKAKYISKSGIINNLQTDGTYNVAIYNGTIKNIYTMTANIHYMTGMERYRTARMGLGPITQTVDIPDYFLDGYYNVDNFGIFRLVHDKKYDKSTDFNKRLLEINQEQDRSTVTTTMSIGDIKYVTSPINATSLYSDIPEFNKYIAKTPGSFGWSSVKEDNEDISSNTIDKTSSEDSTDTNIVEVYDDDPAFSDFTTAYKKAFDKDWDNNAILNSTEGITMGGFTDDSGKMWSFADVVTDQDGHAGTHVRVSYKTDGIPDNDPDTKAKTKNADKSSESTSSTTSKPKTRN